MWRARKYFLSVLLLYLYFFLLYPKTQVVAQNPREKLNKEKKEKLNKIKEIASTLNETTTRKNHTLGELNALDEQIKEQEGLVVGIKKEVDYLETEIIETNSIVLSMDDDLKRLKKEYSAMAYATYKANQGLNKITFLFSSSSFSELRARYKYMEQYAEARTKQAERIRLVSVSLQQKVLTIEAQKTEKEELLNDHLKQAKDLQAMKNKRGQVLQALQSEEKDLLGDLEKAKLAVAEIDRKIKETVKAEVATSTKSETNTVLTGTFEKNKNKLPWPVGAGFVSQKFGRQNHPALKNVVIENEGIYIQTKQNEKAKAVFEGDVKAIFPVPSMGYCALIKHGDYYTVYGGLKTPLVKAREKVEIGQALGEVVTKPEGTTLLWFEIRKGRNPLNPEQWLIKK